MFSKIKEIGPKYSLAIVFNRLVPERLFRVRRFDVFSLPKVTFDSPSSAFIAQQQTDKTAAKELTDYQQDSPRGTQQVVVIQRDQKTVAAIWIGEEEFFESELGMAVGLQPTQQWLFSAYVDKQSRRQGLYRELLGFVTNCDQKDFLLAINPDNRRSMAAHSRFGAKRIARVTAWRLFAFSRVKAKSKSNKWKVLVKKNQDKDDLARNLVRFERRSN